MRVVPLVASLSIALLVGLVALVIPRVAYANHLVWTWTETGYCSVDNAGCDKAWANNCSYGLMCRTDDTWTCPNLSNPCHSPGLVCYVYGPGPDDFHRYVCQ